MRICLPVGAVNGVADTRGRTGLRPSSCRRGGSAGQESASAVANGIGLDFTGLSGYKRAKEQGPPIPAEKLPFEPDLGNTSVGNGRVHNLWESPSAAIPGEWVWPFFFVRRDRRGDLRAG